MQQSIKNLLSQTQQTTFLRQGIVYVHAGKDEGFVLTNKLLSSIVNTRTVLYLSGGKTPKELYTMLAKEEKIIPGAVGMIDERFGPPAVASGDSMWRAGENLHNDSNELMMQETGLLRYFQMRDIPFYPILNRHPEFISGSQRDEKEMLNQVQHDKIRKNTALKYDQTVRKLHAIFPKSVGILGVGLDGHTAGLPSLVQVDPALNSNLKIQNSKLFDPHEFVTEYNDTSGKYGERVTMTFLGLSMLDFLIVLVFGDDKKRALDLMFADGSEDEIPSRFYRRPEIAQKTLLITDQIV